MDMWKVLNYPQIYYENLPPPKERRDSLVDQIKHKLGSISSSSPESSVPPTPTPPKARQASVQFQGQPMVFAPQRVRQLRAASLDAGFELQRKPKPPPARNMNVSVLQEELEVRW